MPKVVIPSALSAALERAAATRATSIDRIVTAALNQDFQTESSPRLPNLGVWDFDRDDFSPVIQRLIETKFPDLKD